MSNIFSQKYQTEILRRIEDAASDVTNDIIKDLIEDHRARKNIMEGLFRRYELEAASSIDSTDGVPILARPAYDPDSNEKFNNLHNPFFNDIVSNKVGYYQPCSIPQLSGDRYSDIETKKINEMLRDFARLNSMKAKMSRCVEAGTGWGTSYIRLYSSDGRARVMVCDAWETIVIKNASTGVIEYALRYWDIEDNTGTITTTRTVAEWYDAINVTHYINKGTAGAVDFVLNIEDYPDETIEEGGKSYSVPAGIRPHLFKGCPIIEFPNNLQRRGDAELTLTLQDAYNQCISDESSMITGNALGYLVSINNGMNIDEAVREKIQKSRTLVADEDGKWEWLQKSIDATAIDTLLDRLKKNIYDLSNSYDPSDDSFSGDITAFQIAMKLMRLDNSANKTDDQYQESFMSMYTLLCTYWAEWHDIKIDPLALTFPCSKRIPVNVENQMKMLNEAGATPSNQTVWELSSLDIDYDEEKKRLSDEYDESVDRIQDVNTGGEEEGGTGETEGE